MRMLFTPTRIERRNHEKIVVTILVLLTMLLIPISADLTNKVSYVPKASWGGSTTDSSNDNLNYFIFETHSVYPTDGSTDYFKKARVRATKNGSVITQFSEYTVTEGTKVNIYFKQLNNGMSFTWQFRGNSPSHNAYILYTTR